MEKFRECVLCLDGIEQICINTGNKSSPCWVCPFHIPSLTNPEPQIVKVDQVVQVASTLDWQQFIGICSISGFKKMNKRLRLIKARRESVSTSTIITHMKTDIILKISTHVIEHKICDDDLLHALHDELEKRKTSVVLNMKKMDKLLLYAMNDEAVKHNITILHEIETCVRGIRRLYIQPILDLHFPKDIWKHVVVPYI